MGQGEHCWNCAFRNGYPFYAQPDKKCENFFLLGKPNTYRHSWDRIEYDRIAKEQEELKRGEKADT